MWNDERWNGIKRNYTKEQVNQLRGEILIDYTLSSLGSRVLLEMLTTEKYVKALGAVTGNQAIQMVQAGLKAIYLSGWQVAADANLSSEVYPDMSLYPSNSAPALAKRINSAFQRADQVDQGKSGIHWFAPIIADGEAGFGGILNVFEMTKSFIEAGVAAVHFEDQLSSVKKCGHMGGKVIVPTREFIEKLLAARLASDVLDVPLVIIARTDANSATLLTSDIDVRDQQFTVGNRTIEGFFRFKWGIEAAIARGLAYAPYCDLLWCETSRPDLKEAQRFADGIHEKYPDKKLCYNCSPSFNWEKNLDANTIRKFQDELGEMGYKFQFITLAGFHSLNHSMFELARGYMESGMTAYTKLQHDEFKSEKDGYTAVKHQQFVGAGYFDRVTQVIQGDNACTISLKGSTEKQQF